MVTINWTAVDKDGRKYGYESKPTLGHEGYWQSSGDHQFMTENHDFPPETKVKHTLVCVGKPSAYDNLTLSFNSRPMTADEKFRSYMDK